MKTVSEQIEERMKSMRDEAQSKHLMRFFKCGVGEYGEGDLFLGIRVPVTREIVKEFRNEVEPSDVIRLTSSPWHEIRLAGFLLLIEIYRKEIKKKNFGNASNLVNLYLSLLDKGNNWDLVDLVAPKILGDWLIHNPGERELLYQLAEMEGKLWHQRTAIVANWSIIRSGSFEDTFRITEKLINHPHDLIHKACGWMLREIGKRGGKEALVIFLEANLKRMPRTMLRYAIEHFPEEERKEYLRK